MEGRTGLDRLRPTATRMVAVNARLLEQRPTQKGGPPGRAPSPLEPLTGLPGGVADGLEKHLEKRAVQATNHAERIAKGLTKAHLKGVGWVGDAAELVTAEDKGRAAAGIVGGRLAASAAGFIPPQLVTVPVASVLGGMAGKYVYDRAPEIGAAAVSELATLRDQLGRELKRYAPYDLPDRILRR